jgi:ATP-dependent DNA ligase
MLYYAFDLLFLDGFDLPAAPLDQRRRVRAEQVVLEDWESHRRHRSFVCFAVRSMALLL